MFNFSKIVIFFVLYWFCRIYVPRISFVTLTSWATHSQKVPLQLKLFPFSVLFPLASFYVVYFEPCLVSLLVLRLLSFGIGGPTASSSLNSLPFSLFDKSFFLVQEKHWFNECPN